MKKTKILDVCCGSKMFYFDRDDKRVLFCDKRKETHTVSDSSSSGGKRTIVISPDLQANFTELPFKNGSFHLVIFDPPHLLNNGENGWMAKKYGKLKPGWELELQKGFSECFRVLKKNGTLVFKWNENDIPVSKVLSLTSEKPVFGNKCGKQAKSHWLVFFK